MLNETMLMQKHNKLIKQIWSDKLSIERIWTRILQETQTSGTKVRTETRNCWLKGPYYRNLIYRTPLAWSAPAVA